MTGSRLESAAMRYAEAATEVRRLTRKLGDCDEVGQPLLVCMTPLVDARTQTSSACRKWHYGQNDIHEGWVSARPRSEWCAGCIKIQEIVSARRAAKFARRAALSAIGNIARGMLRRARCKEAIEASKQSAEGGKET